MLGAPDSKRTSLARSLKLAREFDQEMNQITKKSAAVLCGAGVASLSLAACSLTPSHDYVSVHIGLPQLSEESALLSSLTSLGSYATSPTKPIGSVDDFECFAVNVYGNGIGRDHAMEQGLDCPYRGVTSTIADRNDGAIILQVPSGAERTVQMIGIATYGKACPTGQNLEQFERSFWEGNANPAPTSAALYQMVELGKTKVDLFRDTKVEIQNTFHPTAANSGGYNYPFGCPYTAPTGAPAPSPSANPSATPSANPSVNPVPVMSLPLTHAFIGIAPANLAFSDVPGGTLPPAPVGSLTAMTATEMATITDPSNPSLLSYTTNNPASVNRADFLFDPAGLDVNVYHNLRFEFTGASGYSSGCIINTLSYGDLSSQPGFNISFFNAFQGFWLSPNNYLAFTPITATKNTSVHGFPLNEYQVDEGVASPRFHITVRGTASTYATPIAGDCAVMGIQNVKLWAEP
jgi:hypothetical protein